MFITVVMSTRNRDKTIAGAVKSILQCNYPEFELIVVDQSTNDRTQKALQIYTDDPRFHLVESDTIGVSCGRNSGIELANGEIIAITDDDCEVPSNWLAKLAAAFSHDEQIAIVYGNVWASVNDRSTNYTLTYVRNSPYLARNFKEFLSVDGIGACLGIKKRVWRHLYGFDCMLGTGSVFKAGEETDISLRALLNGYYVYAFPDFFVIHYGARNHRQAKTLIQSYWFGTGAVLAKNFKSAHFEISIVLAKLALRWIGENSRVTQSFKGSSYRFLRLASFLYGFFAGTAAPVDHTKVHFRLQPSDKNTDNDSNIL